MTKHRRPLAWLLFLALLFTQVANAAYACTRDAAGASDERAAFPATAKAYTPVPDCGAMAVAMLDDGVGMEPLCADHCTHGAQVSGADAHIPAMLWLPASLLGVLPMVPAADPAYGASAYLQAPGMERPLVPAIPILLGRFLS